MATYSKQQFKLDVPSSSQEKSADSPIKRNSSRNYTLEPEVWFSHFSARQFS